MTIIQLAKCLQLAGFLLASVFGGILLDEVVGGRVARGFVSLFAGFADRLRKLTQRLAKDIIGVIEPDESVWPMLPICFFWIVSLTTLIIGWLEHISVLLWIGVGLYSTYASFFLLLVPVFLFAPRIQAAFFRTVGIRNIRIAPTQSGKELSTKEFLPLYVLGTALAVSGTGLLLLLAQHFLSFFLAVSSSTMRMLANPRVPKAAFTVLGYLMLLAGLIIDAVAVF